METIYTTENFKILLFYIIIPLTVVLILFFIGTKIYTYLNKDKNSNDVNYAINYWSNVLGIIFTAILLSVSVGFAFAFIKTLHNLNIVESNIVLYYFFMFFPIIPFLFLIFYIRIFLYNMRLKEKLDKESEANDS